jgi:hypothetical protein
MPWPRVRLTVQGMMLLVATPAVAWAFFFGIAHLIVYDRTLESERHLRASAAFLEAKNDARAAGWWQAADQEARRNGTSRVWVATLLGLLAVWLLLVTLARVLETWERRSLAPRSPLANTLVVASALTTKVFRGAIVLAVVCYLGVLLLVLATAE